MTLLLEDRLLRRKDMGNLRQLPPHRNLIDFSSNDTLGLTRSEELMDAVFREWCKAPHLLGSTGSRLLTGNSVYAESLEQAIATFHGYESGLLFPCGYMANLGLISTLAGEGSTLFFDAQVHASVRDGIRLSRAPCFPFRHNDLEHLEQRLRNSEGKRERWICVESIYSTDGSQAPLRAMCELAKKYHAHLIVDEAHAVGVYGPNGRGLVAEHNLVHQVYAQVVTFGKALGVHGAIVLGGHLLRQSLINFSTPSIYTTALPVYSLAAIKCSYDIFPQMEEERRHVKRLVQLYRQEDLSQSETHIQSVTIPGNHAVHRVSEALACQGFDVKPLKSPTVVRGQESLRICLHAFNKEAEIRELIAHVFTETESKL